MNALKVLSNIGLSFLDAREGPHREGGKLDTLLTDTMIKICNFTTEDCLSFLVDEDSKDDMFTLGISRRTLLGMGASFAMLISLTTTWTRTWTSLEVSHELTPDFRVPLCNVWIAFAGPTLPDFISPKPLLFLRSENAVRALPYWLL